MAVSPQEEGAVVVAGQTIDDHVQSSSTQELGNAVPSQFGIPSAVPKESRQINDTSILPPQTASDPSILPSATVSPAPTSIATITVEESQPMTAVSSESSTFPPVNGSSTHEATGPSPYGTRSRNRTGTHRPNYAEDREVEADYEYTTTKKSQVVSTTASSAQLSENDKASTSTRRRSIQGTHGTNTAKPGGAGTITLKDHIPGTSSFLVISDSSTQQHSRKRKAPGTNIVSSGASAQASAATSHKSPYHSLASVTTARETNMLTFETSQGYLKHGTLVADDGTKMKVNDHVYLVCEPPGEPYYIARIMEFLHIDNDQNLAVESLRINWLYRPRDIGRKVNDTRLVYVTMHSDTCPLQSLRGKCQVGHRDKIGSMDDYRKMKNCFYFSQMFDRYIRRYYDVIPTKQVINVPENVKKVLDARWTYVIVESGRGKELTSAIKSCKRCTGYCASNDSVDCAMCKNTYHMNCVRPPLLKKPARGFAWSCGPCSRKQERKLEARNTPLVGERAADGDEEEFFDEEEEEHGPGSQLALGDSPGNPTGDGTLHPATSEQLAQAKLWPYRYLGIHCRVEDALDYDDRIYPRAISRLGPRHQANVIVWHGRPLEYVKPADIKKKYVKGGGHKKDPKLSKDTVAALEADKLAREKRPKWVIDEPLGFVHRGDDHANNDPASTAKVCFRLPQIGELSARGDNLSSSADLEPCDREQLIEDYMKRARKLAPSIGLQEYSTNFLDKALQYLYNNDFDAHAAFRQLQSIDLRKDIKEPKLNKEELKRFEDGVAKYGTNLHEVSRHVGKSQKHGDIVRFYYMWKKTDRGKQIWGNFEGRKGKQQARQVDSTLMDDVADDVDDSAFDNEKAVTRKRGFECKFCFTRHSRFWRRAPNTAPGTTVLADPVVKGSKDKAVHLMVALCHRCAGLWRRYAIQWENIDEVAKKVAQSGGRAWKRKLDEELLIELVNANEASSVGMSSTAVAAAAQVGIDVPTALTIQPEQEAARKKLKANNDKELSQQSQISTPVEPPKKKIIEKPPEPPLIPEQPRIKILPCFVCNEMEPTGEDHFTCRHCRLTAHRDCYGIPLTKSPSKWTCDMCLNDATGQLSTSYECVLCPVRDRESELMEPPKATHKKKTDREREKERLEKELLTEATQHYLKKQEETGRPLVPREPLKKTSGNNWIHVTCAVWNPWIKFGEATLLEPAEGVGSIPQARYGQFCKICKANTGVCVTCHKCPATFHVTCAQQNGYQLGFDVTPVKSSRRDVINTVTLGTESGNVEAVVFCKDHAVKTILHPMHEHAENSTTNALQLFVRNFKQADLSLTGTVRKAAIISLSVKPGPQGNMANSSRPSISNMAGVGIGGSPSVLTTRSSRVSPAAVTVKSEEVDEDGDRIVHLNDSSMLEQSSKECANCGTEISPKWHTKRSAAVLSVARKQLQQQQPKEPNGIITNPDSEVDQPRQGVIIPTQTGHLANGNPTEVEQKDKEARSSTGYPGLHPTVDHKAMSEDVLEAKLEYLCHRCYMKKLKEPSPAPSPPSPPPPPPPPQQSAIQPNPPPEIVRPIVEEVQVMQPRIPSPVNWAPPPISSAPRMDQWPQTRPLSSNTIHLTNGVTHPPPPQAGGPHNPQPYTAHPPPPFYANGYEQREQHRAPPIQHPVNGVSAAYQAPRAVSGPREPGPYSTPTHGHGSPQYARPLPNGIRSPPMRYQIPQAPPGPPRAAENPFEMPYPTHTSPRQRYHGSHGSPQLRGMDGRAQTPTDGITRNSIRPPSEAPMTNGASASPSLRNLLH